MQTGKWQEIFNRMRKKSTYTALSELQLILKAIHGLFRRNTDITTWVDFLDSLNWPIENRYVILFNEPNHAKEWRDRSIRRDIPQFL